MNSPTPPRNSVHEVPMHRFITPAVRVVSAVVILVSGLGIASVFWKMPGGGETYSLYHNEVMDQNLAATTLPDELRALISPEQQAQMSLPMLDVEPAVGGGTEKYTQLYEPPASLVNEPPASLATRAAEPEKAVLPALEKELLVPQRFEPMRPVIGEKPLSVEHVNKDFQPKPDSVSTAEKSEEMQAMFLFVGNNRMEMDRSSEPVPPMDPFPADLFPIVSAPALQPLQPLHIGNLSPLLPL